MAGICTQVKKLAASAAKQVRRTIPFLTPSAAGWKGAAWGIIGIIGLKLLVAAAYYLRTLDIHIVVLYVMRYVLMGFLAGLAVYVVFYIYRKVPGFFAWAVIATAVTLMDFWPVSNKGKVTIIVLTVLTASLASGAVFSILRSWASGGRTNRIINLLCLVAGVSGLLLGAVFIFKKGVDAEPPVNAALESEYRPLHIALPDPSGNGEYPVLELTYGSGQDRHRSEFGEEADILTDPVDGSRFVTNWEKFHGKARTRYYGFDEQSLPLNARVWYPEGSGPFPLALIVHGNHLDQDVSDPGYEYLGRLMASRGFIFASVDENFLNGSWYNMFDHLSEENDCRGWLLLQHLRVWHEWNRDSASGFYHRVDTCNIALIGHSRGGEAVAVAACFNRLPFYPDDATVRFDFNFNISGIIAIAPVDGQYRPAHTGTRFSNVDYFVIHGSNDMDMQSYHGMRQMQRIDFDDGRYHFKAGVYVFGANHGQFNTRWGREDVSPPGIAMYNRRQIMPGADQEQIAMVYFSAFLEATLKGKREYIRLFEDYRSGIDWLPETIYLNQFEDTRCKVLCDFQEDLDLSTITLEEGSAGMEHLTVWKERAVPMKWGDQDTRAVYLGWNQEERDSLTASYAISKPPGGGIRTDSTCSLYFMLADANEDSNPHPAEAESTQGSVEDSGDEPDDEEGIREAIDLTIELADSAGRTAGLLLSSISPLQPQIEIKLMKAGLLTDNASGEVVFRTYMLPLAMFKSGYPDLDITCITSIRFIFDRTGEGVVILDNVGFRRDASFDKNNCL